MADKRMFAQSIVLSDAFLDMPMSARCLYFTLGMLADDEGFIGNPKSIMRQCGATDDDIKILISKRYVLVFESGVIVIKHWKINNWLRKERIHETTYQEEKALLTTDEKGSYTELVRQLTDNCQPNVNIDKNSIEENRLDKYSNKFVKPTIEEITEYCKERSNNINPQSFYDFYESKGWKIGKSPMKDWKACVRTWERNKFVDNSKKQDTLPTYSTENNKSISKEETEELLKLMRRK